MNNIEEINKLASAIAQEENDWMPSEEELQFAFQRPPEPGSKLYEAMVETKKAEATPEVGILPSFDREKVYKNLPRSIKDYLATFEGRTPDNEDTILLGLLTSLSGTITDLHHEIAKSGTKWTNIMTYILAPSAGGKGDAGGTVAFARACQESLKKDHDAMVAKYLETADKRSELKEEAEALMDDLQQLKEGDVERGKLQTKINTIMDEIESLPKKPGGLHEIVYPANMSFPAFLEKFQKNPYGLIVAQEGSAVSRSWQMNGSMDYSTELRYAFEYEPMGSITKSGGEIKIDQPHLSVMITSTPGQLKSIIENEEDGTFSRFIYYNMTYYQHIRDTYEGIVLEKGKNKTVKDRAQPLIDKWVKFWREEVYRKDLEYGFTQEQARHYNELKRHFGNLYRKKRQSALSWTQRLADAVQRLGGIMELVNWMDRGGLNSDIFHISDETFEAMCNMYQVLVEHTHHVATWSPETDAVQIHEPKFEGVLRLLKDEFKTGDFNEANEKVRKVKRTQSHNDLKDLENRGIIERVLDDKGRPKPGCWKKLKVTTK